MDEMISLLVAFWKYTALGIYTNKMFEFNHYYIPKFSLFHGILMDPGTYFLGHRTSVQIQIVIFPW